MLNEVYDIKDLLDTGLTVEKFENSDNKTFVIVNLPPAEELRRVTKDAESGVGRTKIKLYVEFNGEVLEYWANKSSYKNLSAKWGTNLKDWVGNRASALVKKGYYTYLEAYPVDKNADIKESIAPVMKPEVLQSGTNPTN